MIGKGETGLRKTREREANKREIVRSQSWITKKEANTRKGREREKEREKDLSGPPSHICHKPRFGKRLVLEFS